MELLTREKLMSLRPCPDGFVWWCENCEGKPTEDQIRMLAVDHAAWACWVIFRLMTTTEQRIAYAAYAYELVLGIYELTCPQDLRPGIAAEAAETSVGESAVYAAHAAADAAARFSTFGIHSEAHTTYAAAHTADAADPKTRKQIIEYGIKILQDQNRGE